MLQDSRKDPGSFWLVTLLVERSFDRKKNVGTLWILSLCYISYGHVSTVYPYPFQKLHIAFLKNAVEWKAF